MNEQKHTPGPWSATKQSKTSYRIDTAGEQFPEWKGLAHVFIAVGTEDESKANASLIAAAPDMLLALREAAARVKIANDEGNQILSAWLPDAMAAIQKAGG